MTTTITLTGTATGGVDFDAYIASFFSTFDMAGYPSFIDEQIYFTGTVSESDPESTQLIVLDGEDFAYYYPTHTVSGTATTVTLGTLGDAVTDTGGIDTDADGKIENYSPVVTITGLDISNPSSEQGELHEFVANLMGMSGDLDSSLLLDQLTGSAVTLNGSAKGDVFTGTSYGDTLYGNGGSDALYGASGADQIYGGSGNDTLSGGAGNDKLSAGAGHDKLYGGNGTDALYGGAGNDVLAGNAGNDTLSGGAGNDKLFGGAGADLLNGGSGADTFLYTSISDTRISAAGRDTISGFDSADVIDLSGIDANTTRSGDQAFTFVGTSGFSGTAGELTYKVTTAGALVTGDVNGDGRIDFSILVSDVSSLTAGDFVL